MTSIEYLIEELEGSFSIIARAVGVKKYNEIVKNAIEMHKQEIIDAAERWKGTDFAERYYEETFGSKGSDFKQFSLYEHKDTITSADTQVSKTFLESVPQQETLYTEEQVREAFYLKDTFDMTEEEIIQSIKQPKKD